MKRAGDLLRLPNHTLFTSHRKINICFNKEVLIDRKNVEYYKVVQIRNGVVVYKCFILEPLGCNLLTPFSVHYPNRD